MNSNEKEEGNLSLRSRINPNCPEEKAFEIDEKYILVGEATNKVRRLENVTDHPKTLQEIKLGRNENNFMSFNPRMTAKFRETGNKSINFLQNFVIGHHNRYKMIWDVFILLLVPYNCILAAYK
jgi:hypothetical protein